MKLSFKKKLKPKKKCRYCLSKDNLTYDHKVPIIQGGKDEVSNIQVLCQRCNQRKSGFSHNQIKGLVEWIREIDISRKCLGKGELFSKYH